MLKVGYKGWITTNLKPGSNSNITDPFTFSLNTDYELTTFDFNKSADYTAQLIANKFSNLHLCLSGGLDSEFVAKVLLRNKIPFTPVILLTFNSSETWYAFKFCQENKLLPVIFDFSNVSSIEHKESCMDNLVMKVFYSAMRLSVPANEALLTNVIVSLIKDTTANVLTGYGEPFYNSKTFSEPMGDLFEICDHDYYFNLEYGNKHPGSFYTYTPEIFRSMIMNIDTTLNTQVAKANLYELPHRSKSYSSFDFRKEVMCLQNNVLATLNKKFYRSKELAFVKIHKTEILKILGVDK